MISVALCIYNGAAYLAEQLLSIFHQTRQPDEVILLDDKSTDNSLEVARTFILEHHLQKTWHLEQNSNNLGYRVNFRKAISMTHGDWVALCDQDDIWLPDKLETLENLYSSYPNATIVAGGFDLIDRYGHSVLFPHGKHASHNCLLPFRMAEAEMLPMTMNRHLTPILLRGNVTLGCTMLCSRFVCELYLAHSTCTLPHDWELLQIGCLVGTAYYLNHITIHHRLHADNAIGLPFGERAKNDSLPSLAGRLQVMDEIDAAIALQNVYRDALNHPPLSLDYSAYAKLRRKAILRHDVFQWFKLIRYMRIYHGMFSFQQRLGDLFMILKP